MTLKTTPFHDLHVQMGAKMSEFAGYDMPIEYEGIKVEHMNVIQNVGVFDVSHMGSIVVSGPNRLDFMQRVCSNDISKLAPGKAQYNYMPNDQGGIVDDFIVYCFDDHYMLAVNAANIEKDYQWLLKHQIEGAEINNRSEHVSILAVQGPKAKETLQKETDIDLSEIPYYSYATGKFAGIDALFSNTGYTGAGGFELYFDDLKDAKKVWDALLSAGEEYGIKPAGLGARDTLRLEMAFCLYGNDIDDTTNSLEAGLGWVTKLVEGKEELPGFDILQKTREEGIKNRLIGFHMTGRGIPRHGYEITDKEGNIIGRVTSGTKAPAVNEAIGLGYVPVAYKAPGTEIFIKIREKLIPAEVVKTPFRK
ncbi:MAG: glycine cleavage system aminomethyltransferase GcvT [Porphyromonas sp.]|nr:glycine cleavage system aminomethyltransferase GcvT [Porphyromonas sp.]